MQESDELDFMSGMIDEASAYMTLYGAMIKRVVMDYQRLSARKEKKKLTKKEILELEGAKVYLFSPNGLEKEMREFGFDINIDMLRRFAEGKMEKRSYFSPD